MPSFLTERIEERIQHLPLGLRDHLYRVQGVAGDLGSLHGVDIEKAKLAVLSHDLARTTTSEELLQQARKLGIEVHPVEERVPVLLHGPVAAETLRREEALNDEEIYQAVYWHSTAHRDLGLLGKLVFLADKLDPHKVSRNPYLAELKALAEESLDDAILAFLQRELASMLQHGRLIHPASIEARNHLLMNRR